jgi:hypothetical protein
MAEGGRIETGPAAPAVGPAPVRAGTTMDGRPITAGPPAVLAAMGRAIRAEWAADLLEAGEPMQVVRLAAGDTCLCGECLWLRSVLALLRDLAR